MVEKPETAAAKPHTPSQRWAAFRQKVTEHATHAADELAAREHQRADSTEYHHLAEQSNEGTAHG